MRVISALVASSLLASCSAGFGPGPTRTAAKQREYEQLLLGKVPGKPMSCLPRYRATDMRPIDDNTILFRDGASRTYVNHPQGSCNGLASGHYTLVTRQVGSSDPCRGDIAQVVDLTSGMMVGTCVWGDFIPYTRPGS
jgi:hypothetical protein